jgi:opacity protein-like surface antigen
MKKILIAVALAAAALSASATGLVVEYDYNHYQGTPNKLNHNEYGYVGLIQSTKFGTFDAGLQGIRTYQPGGVDRADGYEIGYSYPLTLGKFGVIPRLAYGSMAHINPAGTGFDLHARYYMPSVEVNYALNPKLGVFTSFSHMNGVNAASVARANRTQAGVDFTLTKSLALRTAYSYNKFGDTPQQGVVLIGTYSF